MNALSEILQEILSFLNEILKDIRGKAANSLYQIVERGDTSQLFLEFCLGPDTLKSLEVCECNSYEAAVSNAIDNTKGDICKEV